MKTLSNPNDRAAILARLDALRHDSPRLWGKMSAGEMIAHLNDSFRVSIGERPSAMSGGLFQRTVMKWVALYTPVTWPKNLPTLPENDPQAGGTRPAAFAADVADLRSLVDRFAATKGTSAWGIHPIFGPLTDEEWHRWGYLHMDHHLRQFGA